MTFSVAYENAFLESWECDCDEYDEDEYDASGGYWEDEEDEGGSDWPAGGDSCSGYCDA